MRIVTDGSSFDRALELLDLTLADRRRSGPELKEICRMREVVCDFLVGANAYESTAAWIEGYFTAFALTARPTAERERRPEEGLSGLSCPY